LGDDLDDGLADDAPEAVFLDGHTGLACEDEVGDLLGAWEGPHMRGLEAAHYSAATPLANSGAAGAAAPRMTNAIASAEAGLRKPWTRPTGTVSVSPAPMMSLPPSQLNSSVPD